MTQQPDPRTAAPLLPSLRTRVLRRVLVPLAAIWLMGTLASVLVANTFTQRAFDRALLDDASAIAASVRAGSQDLEFTLSPREIRTLLFDQVETVYFAVLRADGSLLAGNAQLPMEALADGEAYRFQDIRYRGQALRAVRLRMDAQAPFEVLTAQTVRARSAMLRSALLYALAPQLALLALLAWWLRRGVQRELQPLGQLQEALAQRDARDLTPLALPPAGTRDLQRLAAAVNDLLARVATGVRAQHEFAGNVAHELRTPLAGIRAQADYALAQAEPAVWREQLAGVLHSEARASHLVDQLLALALADEAQNAMPLVPVALDALVQDCVLRFLARADAQQVDLGARGLDEACQVRAQPLLLEGILNNLVDNALRYGRPPDGTPAQVTLALAREGDEVLLCVLDNGAGLAPGQYQSLRQRWVRGDAGERLGQGAGLGLGIVGRYAQLLGATLQLHPGPDGRGLAACLRLPVV